MEDNRRVSFRNPGRRLSTATRVSIAPNISQTTQNTLRTSMTTTNTKRYILGVILIIIEEQLFSIHQLQV